MSDPVGTQTVCFLKHRLIYEYVLSDDQRIKTRFFSQDLSKYFWMFECTNGGGVSSYESCTGTSVFELHIKDIRDPPTVGTELNLNVFPWGFALQDLKDFTGLTISELTYTWLGIGENQYM